MTNLPIKKKSEISFKCQHRKKREGGGGGKGRRNRRRRRRRKQLAVSGWKWQWFKSWIFFCSHLRHQQSRVASGASCRVATVGFQLVFLVLVLVSQGHARGSGAWRFTHDTTAATGRMSTKKSLFCKENPKQTAKKRKRG